MINTTLCYIEHGDSYLMLHRVKKENDLNKDKWIGIGGKFEENESPDECLLRECLEETGLTLTDYHLRGIVTFVSDEWECEQMFLYTAAYPCACCADAYPDLPECNEGVLEWVKKKDVCRLPIWEGDKLFFEKLSTDSEPFTMKLVYEGDKLVDSKVWNSIG